MKTGRLNHIDALRGSVMLLLVPYHGLLFLQTRGDQLPGLDPMVFWLHLWRMGLFFAVSGFLAAMTIGLWGPRKQVGQRVKRIAVPLAVAMLTIIPLQKLIVIWFFHQNNPESSNPAFEYTLGNLFGLQPHHLWFLSYLLVFNLVAVAIWMLIRRTPRSVRLIDRAWRWFLRSPLLVPGLASLGALALWLGGYLQAPGRVAGSLVPLPSALAYYGVFFVFGWMLWRSRDLIGVVEGKPGQRLALALPASVVAYALYSGAITLPQAFPIAPTVLFMSGVAVWTTIFMVWGFFARFLSGARPWVRYLADASYWIYLIHIPILVLVQLSLARSGQPPILRLGIATTVSIGVSLATYALLIRYSVVGNLLHGRRERRRGDAVQPTAVTPLA